MQDFAYYTFLIYITGMLGIWKAVPVGLAIGAEPLVVWLMTSLGAITAVIILYFFGNRIREYIFRKRKSNMKEKKDARAARIFQKYGTAGLGLLGCLLMGPNMTMLIGLMIVKSSRNLLTWTIAGILIWSLALTLVGSLSIDLFTRLASYFS